MRTCKFNNLCSLCTAIFLSEGKGQLCTCYYLSISMITSTQFPLPKRAMQVFSFADHSLMTWPYLSSRVGRIVYGLPWDTNAEDVLMRTGWGSLETKYKLRLTEFVFVKCLKVTPSRNSKICFYRGIQAAEEMRKSFFQDQKQILSGTPYALEEQSHGTLERTRKQGLKPWKNLNAVLWNLILIKWISNLFWLQLKIEMSVTNTFNSFKFQLNIFTTYFSYN